MKKLEEAGMTIGDFAMSLMETGKISKGTKSVETARPAELPATDVDISDVKVPSSMMDKVLQESFNVGNEVPEKVQEPQLSEQEILEERVVILKSELIDTVNKLTSLVSEMVSMGGGGVTTTQSNGAGSSINRTGKYRGRNKPRRTIRRKKRKK